LYNFTLIKLCFSLITGTLLGFYLEFAPLVILITGIVLFLFFTISFFQARKRFHQNPIFGVLAYFLFVYIGFLTSYSNLPTNIPDHFTNQAHYELKGSSPIIVAEVLEILKPNDYQDRYILKVKSLDAFRSQGRLLLNITKDSLFNKLKIGQRIAANGQLEDIKGALNPYQFDYNKYMKTLGVYKQLNLSHTQLKVIDNTPVSARAIAGKLRDKIILNLKKQSFAKDELAVIQALLLGQRQELSPEIQKNYAAAGVIHILAVSGLHVGIILLMLSWLLKFLDRVPYGKTLKTLILLAMLWGFALIAGLSPSVVRAVSMFSFVAIGMQLKRRTSILNTLFASLLILLLLNPLYAFQVGFQLSYAAVFAIVVFQPAIMKLMEPKYKVTRYLWKIVSVTLAAQIGVLPLSLFYFHQFPGLFLVSNILILPFMGLILAIGIILILLILLGLNPFLLSRIYAWMISVLNDFVAYIASNDAFLIKDISISAILCITFCFFLISLSFIVRKVNFKNFVFVLTSILIIQMGYIYEKSKKGEGEFIVFHKSRSSGIGIASRDNLNYYSSNIHNTPAYVNEYALVNKIKLCEVSVLKNIYTFAERDILVLDSLGMYKVPNFNPKYIVLTNSPKINLDRLLNDLKPEQLIVDGSNYKTFMERWKKTALNKKVPFHATAEKGAFIIKHQ